MQYLESVNCKETSAAFQTETRARGVRLVKETRPNSILSNAFYAGDAHLFFTRWDSLDSQLHVRDVELHIQCHAYFALFPIMHPQNAKVQYKLTQRFL